MAWSRLVLVLCPEYQSDDLPSILEIGVTNWKNACPFLYAVSAWPTGDAR